MKFIYILVILISLNYFTSTNEYYSSGNIKATGKYDQQKRKTGVWKKYLDNCQYYANIMYKDGSKHGTQYNYRKDGSLSHKTNYRKVKFMDLKQFTIKKDIN